MNSKKSIILFFSLIIIYFLQGSLYESGSLISQISLFILILFNLFYLFKIIKIKNNPNFIKIWTFFISAIILGFILTGDYKNDLFISQLKNILYFMTAIYPIYYWSSKGLISNIHLRNFALVMLPVIIVSFFTSKSNLQIEYDRENVVNNTSYLFVALMPFLFLIKNKNLSLIILFALLAFLVIGAKRGALIIGSVNTVIILFYNLKYMQSKNWKARMRNVLLFTIVFSIGMIYLSDIIESNSYVFERLENNQSTRPENYTALFNNWYNSTSIHHILFGYGYYSSPLYTPEKGMAHNDWLEMLNDFGLFGFILYAVLIISFIKLFKNKWPIDLKYMHITIIISWIFISLLSMWVNNYMNIMYAILMGYLVGNVIQNKRLLGK